MKKLFSIFSIMLVLVGSISGAAIQSTLIGAATLAATNSPEIAGIVALSAFTLAFFLPSSKKGFAYDVVFTEGICEKVQTSLVELFGSNAPSLRRTNVGFLEALLSPQNMNGVEKIPIDTGDGKDRMVRIKYITRGTSNELTTSEPAACATDNQISPLETTVDITNALYTKGYKFNESEMRKLCESDSSYMAGVINSRLDAFMVQLNQYLLTTQSTNFGNFYSGSNSAVTVELLKSTYDPFYYGEAQIMKQIEDIEASARPLVIGSGVLGDYVRQIGIGCCNDGGINLANAGNMDFFRDKYVDSVIGTNHFIALIPGNVQLMTWNKYVGPYAKENDVFSHGTIMDPKTGLVLDMKWHYDDCDDFYSLHFGLNYEMFYLPTNSFQYGDELYGVNGALHFIGAVAS